MEGKEAMEAMDAMDGKRIESETGEDLRGTGEVAHHRLRQLSARRRWRRPAGGGGD
jgi:hypothetical protein